MAVFSIKYFDTWVMQLRTDLLNKDSRRLCASDRQTFRSLGPQSTMVSTGFDSQHPPKKFQRNKFADDAEAHLWGCLEES